MNHSQPQLRSLDDRIEARSQAIRAERDWWPCRRGCDQCCRQLARPLEMSAAEWQRVDEAIAALPQPIQLEITANIHALLNQIAAGQTDSQIVCPYLDQQEGACRIYRDRPVACRTYGFFVARTHDQYCRMIETEVASRGDTGITWGNAEVIQDEVERISSPPIPFEEHYCH